MVKTIDIEYSCYHAKSEIQNLKFKPQIEKNQNASYFSSDFQIDKNYVNQLQATSQQIVNFIIIGNLRQPYHHKFKISLSETNCRVKYVVKTAKHNLFSMK